MSPSDTPPSGDDPGVLSGLSRTRPQRRSNKRPGRPKAASATAASAPASTPATPATPKSRAKAKAPARGKAKAPAKAAATPPKKTAPAAERPARKQAAEAPAVEVGRTAEPQAQRPTVAAAEHNGGVDLIGQAINAAGEVAHLGVDLGRQVAKGILSRLPKP